MRFQRHVAVPLIIGALVLGAGISHSVLDTRPAEILWLPAGAVPKGWRDASACDQERSQPSSPVEVQRRLRRGCPGQGWVDASHAGRQPVRPHEHTLVITRGSPIVLTGAA
jgi:hypothetical protein